jgi:DNA excision repair protein ERCC-2
LETGNSAGNFQQRPEADLNKAARLITISLIDFALPVPRTGSIEAHSGYGRSAVDGQEIHARVQRKRAKADPLYQAEVPIRCHFDRRGYRFRVDGRMDGFFRHDPPRIEEIKSGFGILELALRLADDPMSHPYGLQLLTYGYIYWREHGILPALCFHLVSSRNGESRDLSLALDLQLFEGWLDSRLEELCVEARKAENRAARRRKISVSFPFPFPNPRPGQIELMEEIGQGMKDARPMLVQAPTGLGKTVGVLYPSLREAMSRGQRVVYVTPKNSQHSVAEDAVTRFQAAGARVKSLSITAKAKICFKNEPLCSPEYCEYARDYYAKVHAHGILGVLAKKRKLKTRIFRDLGEKYQVCPFELQFDGVREADIVICDYNYVFAPRSALNRVRELGIGQAGKPNLVIDEAHNLPARAMDYYSPSLSSLTLEGMREGILKLSPRFRREAEKLLDGCIQTVNSCRQGERAEPMRIAPPSDRFLEQDTRLRAFMTRYLDSDAEIRHRDVILGLCFYWSQFTEILDYAGDSGRQGIFATYHPHPTGGTVKITCCDASAMLADCYGEFEQVVGFSATLKPFEYYLRLSGLNADKVRTAEFGSPFPPDRRKLLIIPQISTRYSHREYNYAKIAEAVQRIAALRNGNYFVFFPSFDFLGRVAALFRPPQGFSVLKQERGMKPSQVGMIVETLRDQVVPTLVFAVQGGSLSEGLDYAGDSVIGAFVVGPPLPNFDMEREEMRKYYQQRYGAGFDYAYVIPAMARAVQAAGRVIRSETDRGLIVLMDNRFVEPPYTKSMPVDWFKADVTELVSGSILCDVAEFWGA